MHAPAPLSLLVRVDCDAYSRHRDPKGVYHVDVDQPSSMIQNACVAIQTIKNHVAFIHENLHRVTMRVFTTDGSEVFIPAHIDTDYCHDGSYKGRAVSYPEEITLQ